MCNRCLRHTVTYVPGLNTAGEGTFGARPPEGEGLLNPVRYFRDRTLDQPLLLRLSDRVSAVADADQVEDMA